MYGSECLFSRAQILANCRIHFAQSVEVIIRSNSSSYTAYVVSCKAPATILAQGLSNSVYVSALENLLAEVVSLQPIEPEGELLVDLAPPPETEFIAEMKQTLNRIEERLQKLEPAEMVGEQDGGLADRVRMLDARLQALEAEVKPPQHEVGSARLEAQLDRMDLLVTAMDETKVPVIKYEDDTGLGRIDNGRDTGATGTNQPAIIPPDDTCSVGTTVTDESETSTEPAITDRAAPTPEPTHSWTVTSTPAFSTIGNSPGTVSPPFEPYLELETQETIRFQSITFMPHYQKYSFEELRVQDYIDRRRYPATAQPIMYPFVTPHPNNSFVSSAPSFSTAPAGGLFGTASLNLFGTSPTVVHQGGGFFNRTPHMSGVTPSWTNRTPNVFDTTRRGLFDRGPDRYSNSEIFRPAPGFYGTVPSQVNTSTAALPGNRFAGAYPAEPATTNPIVTAAGVYKDIASAMTGLSELLVAMQK